MEGCHWPTEQKEKKTKVREAERKGEPNSLRTGNGANTSGDLEKKRGRRGKMGKINKGRTAS